MVDTELEDDFKLVCEAFQRGEAVLWAGAGLSAYAGYPVGTAFARILTEELGEVPSKEESSLPDIAERYQAVMGREALLNKIREVFGKEPTDVETHRLLSLIKDIPYIVTTNYDRLFERAYGEKIIPIASEREMQKTQAQGSGNRRQILYKPHGDVDHPDQLVITRTDYKQFEKESFLWEAIDILPVSYPIVFIGYSLNDKNTLDLFDKVLTRCGRQEKPHFIIKRKKTSHDLTQLDDLTQYEKYNVKLIEKDAEEAIREISEYLAKRSMLDILDNPYKMRSKNSFFKDRNLETTLTIGNDDKISNFSIRSTNPDIPSTIKGCLDISSAEGSSHFQKLEDLKLRRSFDPLKLSGSECKLKFNAEINGIYIVDPNGPPLDNLTFIPHPDEEKEVDLQIGTDLNRITNVLMKRFVSDSHARAIFSTHGFDLTINLAHATRSVDCTLNIHPLTDIERKREIFTFINTWIEEEAILVIPSGKEKPWLIPSPIDKKQDFCEMIRFGYRFFVDLSDIQKECCIRLQMPENGVTDEEYENITDVASLIRGERCIMDEITMTVPPQFPDTAKFLTDKPVDFECSGPDFKESFEIFGVPISLPVVVEGRGVVLSNLEEARADVERGADTISLRYDGSVGELYQRYIPRSPQTDKEEMKTS